MEVKNTCAIFKVIKDTSKILKSCPSTQPKDEWLPPLPEFPEHKCDFRPPKGASTEDCCASSAITICLVLLALLILLIIFILFLRYWKRKLSKVAIDIGNVTGTKKTSTDLKLTSVTMLFSKGSNDVSDATNSKETLKGTV